MLRNRILAAVLIAATAVFVTIASCGSYSSKKNDTSGRLFSTSYSMSELYNTYNNDAFVLDGQSMTYTDTNHYTSRLGIDVSEHNGEVDWEAVRSAGYTFAFIRIGYRGYGDDGTLVEDSMFEENYKAARKAGLEVGVYFYSQAVNESEAEEEAKFVTDTLQGRMLDLPVAMDMETVEEGTARTDGVTGAQFTQNIRTFCTYISKEGYEPMLYTNLHWETFTLDMTQLYNLPVWFSNYSATPDSTYKFEIWQYSNTGTVDGVSGSVDLDIELIPV
ncbi:MAG: glycoside hydrolase family 25 protein [Eubacterium sp.]|nr:glycoside hydrolase family 25 protein [Eubacterium sp.]